MEFKGEYSFLSNNSVSPIILTKDELLKYTDENLHNYISEYLPNGFKFNCVTQAFQSFRVKNVNDYITLLNTPNGYNASMLSKSMNMRNKWSVYRIDIMEFLIKKKFLQNKDLSKKLAAIDITIHNDVTYNDFTWGRIINNTDLGFSKKGQDMLGLILNNERKAYREAYYPTPIIKKQKSINRGFNSILNLQENIETFISDVNNNYFYVIDTETSGLSPSKWDIIELSAIKVDGNTFNIIDEFDVYINNGYKLPQNIIDFNKEKETGICDELLSTQGLSPKTAFIKFKEFVGNTPIIMGQNIMFDIKFIQKLYKKQGKEDFIYYNCIDTLKMAKEKIPGKHNLDILYSMIPNAPDLSFHKSIDDTKATLEVFKWLANKEYNINLNNISLNESPINNIILSNESYEH